jgi:hypothetical protein
VAGELIAAAYGSTGKEWLVQGDTNGDGIADFAIVVTTFNTLPLHAGDFTL